MSRTSIETIQSDFAFLDDWEDRYRYVIELGRALEPLPETEKNDVTRVRGCASQVWLVCERCQASPSGDVTLIFRGESDAMIVRGLIAILLAIYNGRSAAEVVGIDAHAIFASLGLHEHLTPQRSNGLKSMVERIRAEAASH
ncbi:MAG: SufE family protein [Hyphomicrobiaceae bacterium]